MKNDLIQALTSLIKNSRTRTNYPLYNESWLDSAPKEVNELMHAFATHLADIELGFFRISDPPRETLADSIDFALERLEMEDSSLNTNALLKQTRPAQSQVLAYSGGGEMALGIAWDSERCWFVTVELSEPVLDNLLTEIHDTQSFAHQLRALNYSTEVDPKGLVDILNIVMSGI